MDIISALRQVLGASSVLTGEEVSARSPHVWKPDESIIAKAICLPRSTEEVALICRVCHENNQSIVVHGGLTNLVQSTFSNENDVVVSLEKMNAVIEVDVENRSLTVEAGAILEHIHEVAAKHDLFFPLNFGAKGSCQIGGCVSTNAGGLRVFKYGMTRSLVLGLEAVLANGTIISPMHKIIKNNSGYDTKQLFIGSEGTLGIVTKVVLRLYEKPLTRYSAFSTHDSFQSVSRYLKFADTNLGGNLSAFEIFWPEAYSALTHTGTHIRRPLEVGAAFYVLCEALGGDIQNDAILFEKVMEDAFAKGLSTNVVLATNQADNDWFWNIREDVGNLLSLFPYRQDFDISLPIGKMEEYISDVRKDLSEQLGIDQCYVFGHMADGNLHLIIGKNNQDIKLTEAINDIVYDPLEALEGSVSAEHGIGIDKKRFMSISRSSAEIGIMRSIKEFLDPHQILNRGKIFDLENSNDNALSD